MAQKKCINYKAFIIFQMGVINEKYYLNEYDQKKKFIILLITFLCNACDLFMVGSYPYAEYYEFEMPMEGLIQKVNIFKEENPKYKLFTYNKEKREEVLDKHADFFYHLYFYFEDINQTIHCIIRGKDKTCEIGLSAMSEGVIFADWKTINTKDLTKEENEEIKKKFETEILDKFGEWKHCK